VRSTQSWIVVRDAGTNERSEQSPATVQELRIGPLSSMRLRAAAVEKSSLVAARIILASRVQEQPALSAAMEEASPSRALTVMKEIASGGRSRR